MGLIKFLRRRMRRRDQKMISTVVDKSGIQMDDDCVRKFDWEEIERLTGSFSQVIGTGGYSTVFFGNMSGSSSAIKIYNGSERLYRAFLQERDILLQLRHQNIVKFYGYCEDREEGALVFEYVYNGNLQEKLHGEDEAVLSWRNRMKIAFQLGKAIQHLHENCSLQIVHGDIKPSNILLDTNFNIKLCDFGCAKMGFSSTVLPSSSSSLLMMGSPGYIDPHYLRTGIASKKNDIYSYGVILLELLTGTDALCSESGRPLTAVLRPILREDKWEAAKVAEMMDRRLVGEFDMEEAMALLAMAALCLADSPTLRPSATQILETFDSQTSSVFFP